MAVDKFDDTLHVEDALYIALKKEEESVNFYLEGAKISTDAGTKHLFLALAEEEKKHVNRIKELIEQEIMREM